MEMQKMGKKLKKLSENLVETVSPVKAPPKLYRTKGMCSSFVWDIISISDGLIENLYSSGCPNVTCEGTELMRYEG